MAQAKILDIDETGVTAKFQSQTFTVARYCVRKQMVEKDVSELEWRPASGKSDSWDGALPDDSGDVIRHGKFPSEGSNGSDPRC